MKGGLVEESAARKNKSSKRVAVQGDTKNGDENSRTTKKMKGVLWLFKRVKWWTMSRRSN